MAPPTINETLQVTAAPVFVRKLRRRGDWGADGDDRSERVQNAVEKLFLTPREPAISVYLVSTDEDLRRVALGVNAGRGSPREAVPLVAFLPAEVAAAGIQIAETPGDLPCAHANRLHRDWTATDAQLIALCEAAMSSGRVAGNCSRGMMNDALVKATNENCRTATSEGACQVAGCSPP